MNGIRVYIPALIIFATLPICHAQTFGGLRGNVESDAVARRIGPVVGVAPDLRLGRIVGRPLVKVLEDGPGPQPARRGGSLIGGHAVAPSEMPGLHPARRQGDAMRAMPPARSRWGRSMRLSLGRRCGRMHGVGRR